MLGRDASIMCGTLAVRLSAEAIPVQVLGESARKPQNNRRARQSYRRQSESCHRFIAEMVLRCPPFIWRFAPPVPRQSDSSAKRTPLRWRRQSSSPLRSGLAVEVWWLRMQSRLICCQPRIHQEARGPRVSPPPSSGFGRESVPIDAQQWYCYAPCFENNKVWGHCRLLLVETTWSARPGVDSLRPSSLGWEPDRRTSMA